MAEHLVGVQGLIIAVPCAVYVINYLIMTSAGDEGNDLDTGTVNVGKLHTGEAELGIHLAP